MAQMLDSGYRSGTAAAATAEFLRVHFDSSGTVAISDASTQHDGVSMIEAFAAGDPLSVRLNNAAGTVKMTAAGSFAVGATLYAAAGGKVDDSGTIVVGKAMHAAGANNDVVEVLPKHNSDVATAVSGTTNASFEIDTDSSTPKIALAAQAAGTGDYTTTLKPETTLSGDNAIIVPEADGDTLVAVALAQTLTSKTLTSPSLNAMPKFQNTVTPVAAAGTTVADAGQLASTMVNHITSDGATKGVKFPTGAASHLMIVINNSSTAAELYAASGGTINGLSADASVVIPASKGVLAFATGADTWIAFDLPAKATAS